jgi:hypothetical protein
MALEVGSRIRRLTDVPQRGLPIGRATARSKHRAVILRRWLRAAALPTARIATFSSPHLAKAATKGQTRASARANGVRRRCRPSFSLALLASVKLAHPKIILNAAAIVHRT